MSWGSAGEFFAMGGYGLYVWGSYAVTVILLAVELMLVVGRHRMAKQQHREPGGSAE